MLRQVPEGVGCDVRDDHRRPPIGSGATRAGTGSNRHFFHLSSPLVRQLWPCNEIEMNAVRIQQQNGSKRAAALFLDDQTQSIKDFFQWNARRNHLEEPFLSFE